MSVSDYVILGLYVAAVVILGLHSASAKSRSRDFFLAGRNLRWIPVGLSIMVTVFSATNFTAFSGEVLSNGLYVILVLPAFLLVAFPILKYAIPFHRSGKSISAYDYLESRYDRHVRRLGTVIFVLWRLLWTATALYATAKLASGITGISMFLLIFLAGGIAVTYTAAGGMRSVVSANLFQFAVLFCALAAVLCSSCLLQGGPRSVWSAAAGQGLLKPFTPFDADIFSLNPTIRISLWSALIGGLTAFAARYGVDQRVVQRYMAARSTGDASAGFLLSILSLLAALICLCFLGMLVRGYWVKAGIPEAGFHEPVKLLGRFVMDLPNGVRGLMLTGLLAGTMASLDAGIHSCATVIAADFVSPRSTGAGSDGKPAPNQAMGRRLVVVVGLVTMAAACWVSRLGSIFDIANRVVNGLGSPLLGLFLAGRIFPSVNRRGAFLGGLSGACFSVCVSLFVKDLSLHHYATVNLLGTLLLCALFSARRSN